MKMKRSFWGSGSCFTWILFVALIIYSACGGGGAGESGQTYYADADGDGFGDVNVSQVLDTTQAGWVLDSTDCDDNPSYGASINPAAAEVCDDWTDNECDDLVDCYDVGPCAADAACTGCSDSDSDGYYSVALDCSGGNDCADADSTVNPGVDADGDLIDACQDCDDLNSLIGAGTTELCNGKDDDCDFEIDEGNPGGGVSCDGADSDLCFEGTTSCVAGTLECSDNTSSTEDVCNGLDDDCDPASADGDEDPLFGVTCDGADVDACEEGTYQCNGVSMVCSDTTGDSVETCNAVDDDCDGQTDEEDSIGCSTYYLDGDNDGYGLSGDSRCLCSPNGSYTSTVAGDCDDSDENVNPGATERCNAKDDDCDSQTDEPGSVDCTEYFLDSDLDDYGLTGNSQCLCGASDPYTSLVGGDCDDSEPAVNPDAPDICNNLDDNCDGFSDEDFVTGGAVTYTDLDGTSGLVKGDSCGTGACANGTVICAGNEVSLTCDTNGNAGIETCNGIDDDCDGTVDEDCPQSLSISLISVNSIGAEGNSGSYRPAITPDGRYVAFDSRSTDLVAGDTNGYRDIFVRDLDLGITSRVSVSTAGTEGNNDSFAPGPSSDGRYVVFESKASNLVPDDTNNWHDIFLHDMDLGITSRLSVSTAGTQGNSFSQLPDISSDGRYVTFMSAASNLVEDDSNNEWDIFVHDVVNGITSRVSVSTAGTEGNENSTWPAINSDGRFVVFESNASNLVPDDSNDTYDIFVRDNGLGITSRVSVSTAGTEGDNSSFNPTISTDGRYVVFMSQATNLVVGDTNGYDDVFVRDMDLGITSRISVSTAGTEGNGHSGHDGDKPAISSDGRYVAFISKASNLVPDDTNGVQDIFVHDTMLRTTSRISATTGAESDANCWEPAISADGKYIAFDSKATNLIEGMVITGGSSQVYLKSLQ